MLEYFQFFEGMSVFLAIALKEILIFVGFVLPIYFFNLEPEIVSYAKKLFQKTASFIRK
jgi:hypothetical protein